MHEVSIVESLIDSARSELARAGMPNGRVVRIDISIGPLSCANPDNIRFAFDTLTPSTCLEGAALKIEQPPAICHCRSCNERTEVDDLFGVCPLCGSADVAIDGEYDLMLTSLEIEE